MHLCQRRGNQRGFNTHNSANSNARKRIAHVEPTQDTHRHLQLSRGTLEQKACSLGIDTNIGSLHHRGAFQSVGRHRHALVKHVRQALPPFIVHINHRMRRLLTLPQSLEQKGLSLKIRIHITMIIQVILGQISEHPNIKVDACHPFLNQRMRGHLHNRIRATGMHHLVKELVQLGRTGRGAGRGDRALTKFIGDR